MTLDKGCENEKHNEEFSLKYALSLLDSKDQYDLIQNLMEKNPEVHRLILEWFKKKSKGLKDIDLDKVNTTLNDGLLMEYWFNAEAIISEFNKYGGGKQYFLTAARCPKCDGEEIFWDF